MTAEKTSIRQQVGEEVIGKKPQRSQKYRHYKTANLMGMRANAWFIRESNKMQSDNSMTTQKKEEIRLRKLEQERIQANLFKAVVDLKQEVNNPGEQNPETHLFVTPPNILKQQQDTALRRRQAPWDVTTNTVGMKSMRNLWQSPQDLCHLSVF